MNCTYIYCAMTSTADIMEVAMTVLGIRYTITLVFTCMQCEEDEFAYKGKLKVAIKYVPDASNKKIDPKLKRGSLFVSVIGAAELPIMNLNGHTDASVRIYLLPKQSTFSKRKTKVVKDTLNPTWNEQFEYRLVSLEDLRTKRVLELTVWDYDRRGCNDFIGCLRLGPNPDSSDKHRKEWMDSTAREVEQWEAMLACPGEWIEYEHDLRPSIESISVSSHAMTVSKEGLQPPSEAAPSDLQPPVLSAEDTTPSTYQQDPIDTTSSSPAMANMSQQQEASYTTSPLPEPLALNVDEEDGNSSLEVQY